MTKADFNSHFPIVSAGNPPVDYTRRLLAANKPLLDHGLDQWVFFPGMMFGSMEKWWGAPGMRPASHEGLDLCFFMDAEGRPRRLDDATRLPAMAEGVVVSIMPDLLGHTVVVRQDACPGPALLVFYAHIRPAPELRTGDRIRAGDGFAGIAPTRGRSSLLPPHLHLTLAWADALPPAQDLTWKLLNGVDRSVFVDPMAALGAPCRIIPYNPALLTVWENV